MTVFFINGIDTGIGTTYATGYLARHFMENGVNVTTQKLVETGCDNEIACDISTHRKLMQKPLHRTDKEHTSCPFVFKTNDVPYLAASVEGVTIHPNRITVATQQLKLQFELVLLEASGGLMTPLNEFMTTIDYIDSQNLPVILVTSGAYGNINKTLLAIDALDKRDIKLHAVIYNQWIDNMVDELEELEPYDKESNAEVYANLNAAYDEKLRVDQSTRLYLQRYLKNHYPETYWVDMPTINSYGFEAKHRHFAKNIKEYDVYSLTKYAETVTNNTLYAASLLRK